MSTPLAVAKIAMTIMKYFLMSLTLMIISITGFSQQKLKRTPQTPMKITSDLDRLFQKYKNTSAVTLQYGGESFEANIKIEYNANDSPSAVIMYGRCTSRNHVYGLIDNLVKQKEKSGYRYVSAFNSSIPGEILETASGNTYQKGTQYAKYGTTLNDLFDWFYFEVGDMKRKGNGKSEKFNF
ncbi:MAG: hypothetical protein WKF85_01375 [Chitinophagaceae bacterium]